MMTFDLSGLWHCAIPGQSADIALPGTLDECGIGFPDTGANLWHRESNPGASGAGAPIATRLTRRYTYEGPAVLTRTLDRPVARGKRVFLDVERARKLSLQVNGKPVPPFWAGTLSTPWTFEVTGLLTGRDTLTLTTDNSYPDWPREAIVYSSAATDETQTNWNGLLGFIRLREEEPAFIEHVRVYPHGELLDLCVCISARSHWQGTVHICCAALTGDAQTGADTEAGIRDVWLRNLPVRPDAARWDEDEGHLHTLTVSCTGMDTHTVRFGLRDFAAAQGHFALNGRRIFLRSEANCAVFPETGHPPMTVDAWRAILKTYRGYGVNCMRFHSHCPPEAAFSAADELGMLMQPELSHWNPNDAFASEQSRAYYRDELFAMLRTLANHPSFVMLTLGNELMTDEAGDAFATALLGEARAYDPTRLYAAGSNNAYGLRGCDPASDFYVSHNYHDELLRATTANMLGRLNHEAPDFSWDFAPVMEKLRQTYDGPVFAHEVGQYEVLPDFGELAAFHGVTVPVNYELIRDRVKARGLMPQWERYVQATGELALLCYRAEVEAALRTEDMAGISLLGLQDFPGQGTALVGMLNAHLQQKPYAFARPERFRSFLCAVLPLALLPRFTYESEEHLTARLRMANYGKQALHGMPEWTLSDGRVTLRGTLPEVTAPAGSLTPLGEVDAALRAFAAPACLTLTLFLCGHTNAYPVWVYPHTEPVCPPQICETPSLDERAEDVLSHGGTVYLTPPSTKEALPHSIRAQFSTDFWSVGTFEGQEGGMGQLIDADHPLFAHFPTQSYTQWQWWPMASRRAVILPEGLRAIITEMDSYATLRPMAKLFECRCGGGKLLFSSMDLQSLARYPQARALQEAIYRYLVSPSFAPTQELAVDAVRRLVR